MSTNDPFGAGSSPPPPPPPFPGESPKRRWGRIIAGGALAFLLLIGGCTLLIVRAASGPIDAANEFLADIAAQDWSAASNHLDRNCFDAGATTPDAIRSFFGDDVTSYNLTSTSNQNGTTGASSGTITRTSFGRQDIAFAMTKPADEWLVCGFRIGEP